MTIENFLKSTVKNFQNTHKTMLLTPRARINSELRTEIAEFIDYCKWLQRGGRLQRNFASK